MEMECPSCNGVGNYSWGDDDAYFVDCKKCGGTGKVKAKVCPTCDGDKHHPMANYPRTDETVKGNECPECKGTGKVPE